MALQYLIEYKNLREEDICVEIHDVNYSGNVTDLESTQGSAVMFEYDNEDDPILTHIIHKSIELSVYSKGINVSEIISASDGDKTVKYFKNGVLKFNGILLSDGVEEKETGVPYELKLKAVDGLSILRDSGLVIESVSDSLGSIIVDGKTSSRRCIINAFRDVLNRDIYNLIPMPIRWSCSAVSTQGIQGDLLAGDLTINSFDRLTRGRSIEAYWYIENICKAFNLILEQRDGFWYIYSRKDIIDNKGVLDFWEVSSYLGSDSVTAVKRSNISMSVSADADHIMDDGNYIGIRPVSTAIVSYEDTRHENVLPNGSFDEILGGEVLYWDTISGTAGCDPGVPLNIRGEGNSLRIDNNFDNSPELTAETSVISLVYDNFNHGLPIDTNILFKDIEWGFIFSPINGFNTYPDRDGDFIDWRSEDGIEISFKFIGLDRSMQKRTLYLNSFGYWTSASSNIYIKDFSYSGSENNRTFVWNFEPSNGETVIGDVFEVGIQKKFGDPLVKRIYDITPGLTLSQAMSEIASNLSQDGYSSSSSGDSVTVSGINGMRAFFYNNGSSSEYIRFTVDDMRIGDVASVKFTSKANQGRVLMPDSGVISPSKDLDLGKLYVSIRVKPDWIISFDDFYINTDNSNDVFHLTNEGLGGSEEYTLGISSSFTGFMDSSVGSGWANTDKSMYFSDGGFSGTLTELYGAFAVSWRNKSLSVFSGTVNGDYSDIRIATIHGESYYILSSSYNADKNTSKIKAVWADILDYSGIISQRHYGNEGGSGSGGGSSGGGSGGGGIIQDLQSVLEVGDYATIGGNVSSWIIRDEAVIPNKPSTKENAIWIGAGVNPEPVLDRLVDLSDVSVSGVTDGQALVWSQSLGKWVNGQGGGSEYVLPIATASVLGGIRVGSGLSINPTTGVLSANVTSLDWANITNKPVTFPPSSHTHPISQITGLQGALDAKANATVSINAGTGLTGGGNLTANRTISLSSTTQSDIAKGVLAESWGDHNGLYSSRATVGGSANSVLVSDTRNTNPLPSTNLQRGVWFDFKLMSTIGTHSSSSTYGGSITVVPYSDDTGNNSAAFRLTQSSPSTTNVPELFVQKYRSGEWMGQYRIWHSGNLRSNSENDARYVRLGNVNQTIAGIKTFSGELRLPTTAGTGNNAIWIGAGVNPEEVDDYVLPIATASRLGGIKVGANLNITADGVLSATVSGDGSVTSVGLSAPTGFSVSGSPVTSSGVLALSFASGYSLPTTAKQSQWDTAYGWGNPANRFIPTKSIDPNYVGNYLGASISNNNVDNIASIAGYYTESEGMPTNGTVLSLLSNSSYGFQLSNRSNNGILRTRSKVNGSWTDWVDLFSEENHRSDIDNDARYALRTISVTGAGGLTGGGNLTANRTISLSSATQADIAKGVLAESWGNHANRYVGAGSNNSSSLSAYTGDLNSIQQSGVYASFISTTADNTPFVNVGGFLNFGLSSGITSQLLISRNGSNLAFRGDGNGSNMSPWRIVWHDGNLRSNSENDDRYMALLASGDWNSINRSSTMYGSTGAPISNMYGTSIGGGGGFQIGGRFGRAFFRDRTDKNDWYELYHSGNLRSDADNDARYVRLGNVNQTIQGIKTFGQEVRLPTTAGTGNNAIWIGAGVNPEEVDDYVLPIATASRLGGIKVGANLNITADGVLSAIGSGSGSVTSVGLSAPTGFSVSGSPVTSSGVLGLSFASGYSLPTTAKQGQWDTAYGWGDFRDYGLGTVAPLVSNLDTEGRTTGFYRFNSNSTTENSPYEFGGLISIYRSSNEVIQLALPTQNPRTQSSRYIAYRGSTSVGISDWVKVLDEVNHVHRSDSQNDSRYVQQTRTLTAGDGLTGGGNLTANRTFAVDGTVVRTSGNQTIAGIKTFSGELRLPTTAGTGNNAIWIGAGVNPENVDDTVTVFSTTSTVDRAYLNTNYGSKSTGFMCMNSNTGTTYIKTGSNTWRTITSTVLS